MLPNFLTKLAVHYNRLMHEGDIKYQPSAEIGNIVSATFPIFEKTLPTSSLQQSITDVGSGAGKWTAILSYYFNSVNSIEPKSNYIDLQNELFNSLKISNVEIFEDWMPNCVKDIKTDGVFFAESLYLIENWQSIIETISSNEHIKYIGIIDGTNEKENPFDGKFHQPYTNNIRKLLLKNDEFKIKDILEKNNFECQIFNISDKDDGCQRWFIVGNKL